MNEKLSYHREDDYLLPDLIPPEAPRIGIWGIRRKNYLLKNKEPIYTGLLLSGKLNSQLEEIDLAAGEMFDLLMMQYAEHENVTEKLKAQDQPAWVQRINGIRERVEESIFTELIYQ